MKIATPDRDWLRAPSANDNAASPDGPPAVRAPKRRPASVYAQQGNLLLPLRFARRMPGWNRTGSN